MTVISEIGARSVFIVFLLLGVLSSLTALDPSTLPNWDKLDASVQDELKVAAGQGDDVLINFVASRAEILDSIFLASFIAENYGTRGLLAALTSRPPARPAVINSSDTAIQLLLLENRNDDALGLTRELIDIGGDRRLNLRLAELQFSLGKVDEAKTALSVFLSGGAVADDDYHHALYLLSLILVQDGNRDQALSLLSSKINAEAVGDNPGYYTLLSAELLYSMLRQDVAASAEGGTGSGSASPETLRLMNYLQTLLNAHPLPAAAEGGIAGGFPDLRLMYDKLVDIPRYSPEIDAPLVTAASAPALTAGADSVARAGSADGSSPPEGQSARSDSDAAAAAPVENGLVQFGSYSRKVNADAMVARLGKDFNVEAFVFASDGVFKVLVDTAVDSFRGGENYNNPRRLLLELKESGIEGFVIPDPR